MHKLNAFSLFLISALLSSFTYADLTGKDVLDDCKVKIRVAEEIEKTTDKNPIPATDAFQAGACTGYLKGLEDMQVIYAAILANPSSTDSEEVLKKYFIFCLPDGVTNTDIAKAIVKYLEKNKEQQKSLASFATAEALRVAYPCKRPK